MTNQIVLIEHLAPQQANLISEASVDGKDFYLTGVFCQAEVKNGNARVYPFEEIKKAVDYCQQKISGGIPIAGELNHPNDLHINLERVSHIITDMRMEGNNAIGKAKLLNTPMGNIAKALIEGGMRLGVSSRGSGSVVEGKVSDFSFVTVDIVSNPSAPDAYPDVIRESIENDKVMTLAEAVVHDKDAQKYLIKELHAFMAKLTGR